MSTDASYPSQTAATADTSQSLGDSSTLSGPQQQQQQSSQPRGRQTVKWKIRFDSQRLLFDDTFPEEMRPVVSFEEWEGVLRHLNTDLAAAVHATRRSLHGWTTGTLAATALIVGVVALPVVWVKKSRHEAAMQQFWSDVRSFFADINKKSFMRRGMEWKVVEERRLIRRRDCHNPVYYYRAELLWRKNVAKSKRELARERQQQQQQAGSAEKSFGSSSGVKRRSRPPSNIEPVKEVPSEHEKQAAGGVGAEQADDSKAGPAGMPERGGDEAPNMEGGHVAPTEQISTIENTDEPGRDLSETPGGAHTEVQPTGPAQVEQQQQPLPEEEPSGGLFLASDDDE